MACREGEILENMANVNDFQNLSPSPPTNKTCELCRKANTELGPIARGPITRPASVLFHNLGYTFERKNHQYFLSMVIFRFGLNYRK